MRPKYRHIITVVSITILLSCGCATRHPTLQTTVDSFLKSCETAEVNTTDEMAATPEIQGLRGFYEKYGDGEKAVQEHHNDLTPLMQVILSKSTGAPSPEFVSYLLAAQKTPRYKKHARLLGEILGIR